MSHLLGNKNKEKGNYKGQNNIFPKELEEYQNENLCFKCGKQNYKYRFCPIECAKKDALQANNILTNVPINLEASQLCDV